jgi:CelD/BcsL family acetyltransferase involved in cellulose biosynthesis
MSIALWRGENLVGLAPLYREERSGRVLPLGVSLSDYLDILVAQEDADFVLAEMQRQIVRTSERSGICFPDVGPNASILSLPLDNVAISKSAGQQSPELALGDIGHPLKNVPAHQRQNLRTAENRAYRRGCVISQVAAADTPYFVPALMQLHSARRRQCGDEGLAQDLRVLPFFVEAFAALAREGVVRAYSITCGARLIAGYLGFIYRARASYYLAGFDPAFASESPGTILIGHAMRRAAAEGAHIFDFLRGAEPYKYAWGAQDRQLLSVSVVCQSEHVELAS